MINLAFSGNNNDNDNNGNFLLDIYDILYIH